MERSAILTTMGELKLYGMKAAFDEIITTAVKRQHEPQRIVGDLLTAEISEKQARSIKYQITIAKLPLARDVEDFAFDDTPILALSGLITPEAIERARQAGFSDYVSKLDRNGLIQALQEFTRPAANKELAA